MNAVITYIFGEHTEILRDPLVANHDVEYICVTDQISLRSSKWNIIVDEMAGIKNARDKMALVKYNPFKYTNANNIIVMDGAFQIVASLEPLFIQLNATPLLLKSHHIRKTLCEELKAWVKSRGMQSDVITRFDAMSEVDGISLDEPFLIGSGMIGFNNSILVHSVCNLVLSYMRFLGEDGNMCITNQCPLTYVIEKFHIPFTWFDWNQYTKLYQHNSWEIR